MAKKKLNIPKEKLKDLEGFEDILDLVDIDKREVKKRDTRPAQNFAIYDFLERETIRLRKLDEFFSTKVPNLNENKQYTSLINEQKNNRNRLQSDITAKIAEPESEFNHFLSTHFNKFFDN